MATDLTYFIFLLIKKNVKNSSKKMTPFVRKGIKKSGKIGIPSVSEEKFVPKTQPECILIKPEKK
jgi:hypothetical protein